MHLISSYISKPDTDYSVASPCNKYFLQNIWDYCKFVKLYFIRLGNTVKIKLYFINMRTYGLLNLYLRGEFDMKWFNILSPVTCR